MPTRRRAELTGQTGWDTPPATASPPAPAPAPAAPRPVVDHKWGDRCPGGHGARPHEPGAPLYGTWIAVSRLLGRTVTIDEPYPCRCDLDGCNNGGFWAHCPCRGREDRYTATHLPRTCCTRAIRRR